MVWQHRAHANRSAMQTMPSSRRWSGGGWFRSQASSCPSLPFVTWPKAITTVPGCAGGGGPPTCSFGVTSGLATILPLYIPEGDWQEWVSILSYLLGIVAAVLAIRVVRLIDAGLEVRSPGRRVGRLVGNRCPAWPSSWL